ncbi:MAG: YbaK/EbsC family protein, partial [Betaproteobacteria bacterium]
EAMQKVPTPGKSTCEDVAALLGLPLARTVKCLMIYAQDKVQMLLVRGDHSGNEVKIGKLPDVGTWRWASDAEIVAATGCRPGYLGPVGIPASMPLYADRSVGAMADFVCGANEPDFHLRGVNFGRDCREPDAVFDIRNVVKGDRAPDGNGTLDIMRGIEVGHVFALGNVYSAALGATYLDAGGQSQVMEMGCYGIGVTRVVAAAIEQNNDERGIIWSDALAPFTVVIAAVAYDRSAAVRAFADQLHEDLRAAGVDVLLDDRGLRPGVMFADLELIGIPHRITIGDRGLAAGQIEYQGRREAVVTQVPVGDVAAWVRGRVAG